MLACDFSINNLLSIVCYYPKYLILIPNHGGKGGIWTNFSSNFYPHLAPPSCPPMPPRLSSPWVAPPGCPRSRGSCGGTRTRTGGGGDRPRGRGSIESPGMVPQLLLLLVLLFCYWVNYFFPSFLLGSNICFMYVLCQIIFFFKKPDFFVGKLQLCTTISNSRCRAGRTPGRASPPTARRFRTIWRGGRGSQTRPGQIQARTQGGPMDVSGISSF